MFPQEKGIKQEMRAVSRNARLPFVISSPALVAFPFLACLLSFSSHLLPRLPSALSVPQYQAKSAVFVFAEAELLVPGSLAVLWPTSALLASLLGTLRHGSAGESYVLPASDKARPK